MNDNEYLGALVRRVLESDKTLGEMWLRRDSEAAPATVNVPTVAGECEAYYGDSLVEALEGAVEELGTALPERGEGWTVYDPDDRATWPEVGETLLWVRVSNPSYSGIGMPDNMALATFTKDDRKDEPPYFRENTWEAPRLYTVTHYTTCHVPDLPAPYQEAQP